MLSIEHTGLCVDFCLCVPIQVISFRFVCNGFASTFKVIYFICMQVSSERGAERERERERMRKLDWSIVCYYVLLPMICWFSFRYTRSDLFLRILVARAQRHCQYKSVIRSLLRWSKIQVNLWFRYFSIQFLFYFVASNTLSTVLTLFSIEFYF